MPRNSDMRAHKAEVNCAPRSEVICSGGPKRDTQWYCRAEHNVAVLVSATGIASGHLVYLSTIVNR